MLRDVSGKDLSERTISVRDGHVYADFLDIPLRCKGVWYPQNHRAWRFC